MSRRTSRRPCVPGEMRAMVVVGIENTERRQDMTRPTMNEEDKKIAPRVGESAKFRAFIRDELMPEIDRRVRGNGETAIVGESLAGKALLRGAAATNPDRRTRPPPRAGAPNAGS